MIFRNINLLNRLVPLGRCSLGTNSNDFFHSFKNRPKNITHEMVDSILKKSEVKLDFNLYLEDETLNKNCPIKHIHVNQLAANNPLEDRWNVGFTQVDGFVSSFLFTILDGHSGPTCAHSLAWSILDYVGAACLTNYKLENILAYWVDDEQPFHIARRLELFGHKGHVATTPPDIIKRLLTKNLKIFIQDLLNRKDRDLNPERAIIEALLRLDAIICSMGNLKVENSLEAKEFFKDIDEKEGDLFRFVLSGAVGQVGRIFWGNDEVDNEHTDLYIGNVGDCSTYLFQKNSHGLLDHVHMNDIHQASVNKSEIDRIMAEHPNESASQLFRNGGRILGELAPSRAFGDVRYKWPANRILQLIRKMDCPSSSKVLLSGPWSGLEPLPRPYTNPPYLTARPDVKTVQLTKDCKYVVLATDGLWDVITPEDASEILQNLTEGQSPATLLLRKALTSVPLNIAKVLQNEKTKDANIKVDSLDHAVSLLSLPPGIARYYRDDITVMVIELDVKK